MIDCSTLEKLEFKWGKCLIFCLMGSVIVSPVFITPLFVNACSIDELTYGSMLEVVLQGLLVSMIGSFFFLFLPACFQKLMFSEEEGLSVAGFPHGRKVDAKCIHNISHFN